MSDPIPGFTIEEYAKITDGVIFEVRNYLTGVLGFCDLARQALDPSHPAFSHVTRALDIGQGASAAVARFDRECRRRRNETEGARGDEP